jgi:hypothetical protein
MREFANRIGKKLLEVWLWITGYRRSKDDDQGPFG